MKLRHEHNVNMHNLKGPWGVVGSGWVGFSTDGKTTLWSDSFSGCIGLVMCNSGKRWGALAHLNQMIQNSTKDLELALATVSDFISSKMLAPVTDVMIYYGDPGENLGETQGYNLIEDRIKEVMQCERVIDLRRTSNDTPYGSDFVYHPGDQIVYTSSATGCLLAKTELPEDDPLDKPLPLQAFPYQEGTKAKLQGLGHKGWFSLP